MTTRPAHTATVEVVFKREYTRLIAMLVSRYGRQHIELVEDAVQEALYKATKLWPFQPPEKPAAWLMQVANHYILDQFKRSEYRQRSADDIPEPSHAMHLPEEMEIRDDQLKMMFACCHPALSAADQLMLSLRYLCGFGISEIARALVKGNDAVEKALGRAKKKFREQVGSFELPAGADLKERMDSVMRVIYLQFNEGYNVSQGDQLINRTVCVDAIKLAESLAEVETFNTPSLHALIALMFFQSSRFDTRTDEQGALITLEQQDRSQWDQLMIRQGLIHFSRSMSGEVLTEYHLQAAIASYHSSVASFEQTPWDEILRTYDALVQLTDSPVHHLNRLVALWKAHGAAEAIRQLEAHSDRLPESHIRYVLEGELYRELGVEPHAQAAFQKALTKTKNEVEREFIRTKL